MFIMSFWDMKFLEPGQELQNLLCEAEYLLEQQRIVLVPVSDFRLKMRQYLYKNYINENIVVLEASDFLFYLTTHASTLTPSWAGRSIGNLSGQYHAQSVGQARNSHCLKQDSGCD